MYLLKVITLLMPLFEMTYSARLFPVPLRKGKNRLVLSPNMLRKRQTKQELENELRDKPPFRKYNQETLKVLNGYENNDSRKSLKTKHKDADKYVRYVTDLHDNDAFRKYNRQTVKRSKNLDVYENNKSFRKSLKHILKPKHVDAETHVTYLHDAAPYRKYNQDTIKQSKNFDVSENNKGLREFLKSIYKPKYVDAKKYVTYMHDDEDTVKQSKNFDVNENNNGLRKSLKPKHEHAEKDITYLHDNAAFRKYNQDTVKQSKTSNIYENNRKFLNPKHEHAEKDVTHFHDDAVYRKYNRKERKEPTPKRTPDDLTQYLYEKYNDFRKTIKSNTRREGETEKDAEYYDKPKESRGYKPLYKKYNQKTVNKPKNSIGELAQYLNKKEYDSTNLNDNAYKKYNHKSMQNSKKIEENIEQDLYENDYKKLVNTRYKNLKENPKYLNNAPYKMSLQQFRSLPVLMITLKRSLDSNKLRPENQKNKFLENVIKTLELDEDLDVKRRKYDSTSESSSKEFHSGEKRLFKKWRESVICGSAEMPKLDTIEDDFALRPVRYKSTNRLLNELLWRKLWRKGDPPKIESIPKPQKGIQPMRRKAEEQSLVPPKTEFEFRDLVI